MKHFIAAVQFITILPTGTSRVYEPRGMIPYFPVVGLLLGVMLAIFDRLALKFWSQPVASLLDVVVLVLLTGAFHLDGLGDSADGLLGHRAKETVLEIMKDSRIGVMGLVAIVCALSVKWAGIMSLSDHRSLLLAVIPAYARGSMLFGIRFLQYGRPENGLGRELFGDQLRITAFGALIIPMALSISMGWTALWLNGWFIITTAMILKYYHNRVGSITGDMLGAMTEISEAFLFLVCSMGVFQ
jgi:adenosylcobinamide-GDP ribazoletransferase